MHRTRISRKSGAPQTSFVAHLGSVFFPHQCAMRCQRMSLGETTQHVTVTKIPKDDRVWKTPSTTPRPRCQNCRPKNPPPSGHNCGHRAPNAHRADNERLVDLLLHAPGFGSISKQTCQNVAARTRLVLSMEPPEKYVSECDGVQEAPLVEPPTRCQTERPEDHHRDGNHPTRKAKALVPP